MTKHISLTISILVLTISLSMVASAQQPIGDLLLYDDYERDPSGISAFNPATGETLELPVRATIESMGTSGDGRIAYIQDNDVWMLDVLNAPDSPINITQTPEEEESILHWTPDGKLLLYRVGTVGEGEPFLFYSYDGAQSVAIGFGYYLERYWNDADWYVDGRIGNVDESQLYVWNGQERVNLALPELPAEPAWQIFQWAPNNHLFITIGYNERDYWEEPIGPTDMFYWNGEVVQQVNKPNDDESFMFGEWSNDERLLLYTSENFHDRWYVWDGVTFTSEGVPDTSTLIPINTAGETIDDIAWLPDGRLVIVANADPESDTLLGQESSCENYCFPGVYLWNFQTLQQIAVAEFGSFLLDVHPNGNIAVNTFDGLRTGKVTIFDSDLQVLFQSDSGPYSLPRWSSNGHLAFCDGSLSVWNGQNVMRVSGIDAKWLLASSRSMNCSVG